MAKNSVTFSQPKPFVIFLFSDLQYMPSLFWQQLHIKNFALKIYYSIIGSKKVGFMPEYLFSLFCFQQTEDSDIWVFYKDYEENLNEI